MVSCLKGKGGGSYYAITPGIVPDASTEAYCQLVQQSAIRIFRSGDDGICLFLCRCRPVRLACHEQHPFLQLQVT